MRNEERDGTEYKVWQANDPCCVFLLVHGLGAHSIRWANAAKYLVDNNISSYAVELSRFFPDGKPDHKLNRIGLYLKKIFKLYNIIREENPSKKIFLVGESMGALISFLVCIKYPYIFRGLICLSPAFATKDKLSLKQSLKMILPIFHDPNREFPLPFNSEMCTRDTECRKVLDNDPREHRTISSRLACGIITAQIKADIFKERMRTPALFLLSGDDKLVDPGVSKRIFNSLNVKDKTLVDFPGMYHSLSIEMDREKVFECMVNWAKERI